jgi:TP901-1 family phage major tail protein
MATTSVVNSTLMALYVLDTTYKKIGHLTDASVSITHEPRDITSKDSSGWRELLEGLRSWSASGSGFFAEDATYGVEDILGNVTTRAKVTVRFMTDVSGDTYWEGTAYITSIEKTSSGAEDNVTYSISLEGDGALTTGSIT